MSKTKRKSISKNIDEVAKYLFTYAFTSLAMFIIYKPESQFIKVLTITSVVFAVFALYVVNSNIKNRLIRYFWLSDNKKDK